MINMIPTTPSTIAAKLLVAVVVLALTAFFSYRFGLDVGETKEKEQWTEREKKFTDAEITLRKDHAKELLDLDRSHKQINLKNSENHEIALEKVQTSLAAERAKSRALGGLRIPVDTSTCRNTGASTQTPGAGERNEEAATTVALPERIEADLWSTVGQADEVLEQARACQAWIIDNGFYGKDPAPAD